MSLDETVSQDVQVDASRNDKQSSPSIAITSFDPTVDEARNRYIGLLTMHRCDLRSLSGVEQ